MSEAELIERVVAVWRRHDAILLGLLDAIPAAGLAARPAGSRGRDVARQFFHCTRVRLGWCHYHATGERPKLERKDKGEPPTKTELRQALRDSGAKVEALLGSALQGKARVRMFGKDPVRWMGYLLSHESHHRGQILLALKQSGIRLPEKVVLQGLWGKWISGK